MKSVGSAPPDSIPSDGAPARPREDRAGFARARHASQERLQCILGDREVAAFGDAERALGELFRQWSRRAQRRCAQDRERFEAGARRFTDGKIHSRTLASTSDRQRDRRASAGEAHEVLLSGWPDRASGWPDRASGWPDRQIAISRFWRWQEPCFVPSTMNNLQPAARTHSTGDLLELLRDRAARCASRWTDLDATHVDVGDLGRIARLVETNRSCAATERSFAVMRARCATTYNDVAVAGGLRSSARHYSLALLALVDALAAEPSCSPLAAPHPLDDLRAAAFFVASESVSSRPDHELVERSVAWVDRCLADLRMPLRATGYLSARDELRAVIDSIPRAGAP